MKYLEKATSHKMKHTIIWIFPFLFFFISYIFIGYFLNKTDLTTPNLIGKNLKNGLSILSNHHLGLRLLTFKEDQTLPELTVIDQLPSPNQKIKQNQNVFVTLSIKQKSQKMPDLWGKKYKDTNAELLKNSIEAKNIHIKSEYQRSMCIGQYPNALQDIHEKKVIIYISDGKNTFGIMPHCIGLSLNTIKKIFKNIDARVEIFHSTEKELEHNCSKCTIINQQPAAGTIIDTAQSLHIQVHVEEFSTN